jgi:hypothetical protein
MDVRVMPGLVRSGVTAMMVMSPAPSAEAASVGGGAEAIATTGAATRVPGDNRLGRAVLDERVLGYGLQAQLVLFDGGGGHGVQIGPWSGTGPGGWPAPLVGRELGGSSGRSAPDADPADGRARAQAEQHAASAD